MSTVDLEVWRSIPGWEGLYEASSTGQIRSLPRVVIRRDGHRLPKPGVVLRGRIHQGYRIVNLSRDGKRHGWPVHRLVALTFYGPLPPGLETRHLDGNSLNNAAANLAYGTHQENLEDRKRHGTCPSVKTHCVNGHPFDGANTVRRKDGRRRCRACRRATALRYRAEQRLAA